MKTYSVAILTKHGYWITNWNKYFSLDDIDFEEVEKFAKSRGDLGYGYCYGTDSSSLTSSRNRTVLFTVPNVLDILQKLLEEYEKDPYLNMYRIEDTEQTIKEFEDMCPSCRKGKAGEPHICPYQEDIYDNLTQCTCCEECYKNCVDEV